MKKQYFVQLEGSKTTNITSNQKELWFEGANGVKVHVFNGIKAEITTPKGKYQVIKHPVLGIYQGCLNGVKVHLTHKCWVGQLIYWYDANPPKIGTELADCLENVIENGADDDRDRLMTNNY